MRKVLFIEDDLVTHKLVKHSLGSDFDLISCYTIAEANKVLDSNEDISIVLVDRSLPDGDGLSVCCRLRQEDQRKTVPIIFLSSASAETDKVGAFFAGADDYITKPFGLMELKARIQARLKKSPTKIYTANLEVDLESHRAHFKNNNTLTEITLTRTEFQILATLIQSLDQVFSREMLLSKVWGESTNVSDRVVDSHISHLRRKLTPTGINLESLRGEGYRMTVIPMAKAC